MSQFGTLPMESKRDYEVCELVKSQQPSTFSIKSSLLNVSRLFNLRSKPTSHDSNIPPSSPGLPTIVTLLLPTPLLSSAPSGPFLQPSLSFKI